MSSAAGTPAWGLGQTFALGDYALWGLLACGVIVGLAVVAAILVFNVRCLRKAVFPYREQKRYITLATRDSFITPRPLYSQSPGRGDSEVD